MKRRVGWVTLGAAFLIWELLGLKRVKTLLARWNITPPRFLDHDSLSQNVWELPLPVRLGIDLFLIDVAVHFAIHTPLL